jgi:hypothetical protein
LSLHDRSDNFGIVRCRQRSDILRPMPVQPISRRAFEELHPARPRTFAWLREEVEWFIERSRAFVAFIVKNVDSNDWSFVIEGRDERGQFHPVESREHLASYDDARARLEVAVNRLMASGVKVFPRSSYLR